MEKSFVWLMWTVSGFFVLMSVIGWFTLAVQNALFFAVAAALNIWAALSYGFPMRRAIAAATATLAVFYFGSYIWLAHGTHTASEIVKWSQFLQGVARITIPVVWWGQAILSIQFGRTFMKNVTSKAEEHG